MVNYIWFWQFWVREKLGNVGGGPYWSQPDFYCVQPHTFGVPRSSWKVIGVVADSVLLSQCFCFTLFPFLVRLSDRQGFAVFFNVSLCLCQDGTLFIVHGALFNYQPRFAKLAPFSFWHMFRINCYIYPYQFLCLKLSVPNLNSRFCVKFSNILLQI